MEVRELKIFIIENRFSVQYCKIKSERWRVNDIKQIIKVTVLYSNEWADLTTCYDTSNDQHVDFDSQEKNNDVAMASVVSLWNVRYIVF